MTSTNPPPSASRESTKHPSHIIFASVAHWSHVIVNVQIGLRILAASPSTYLTYIGVGDEPPRKQPTGSHHSTVSRIQQVLQQYTSVSEEVRARLQVLEVSPKRGAEIPKWKPGKEVTPPDMYLDGFERAWVDLSGPTLGEALGSKWRIKPTVLLNSRNLVDLRHILNFLAKKRGIPLIPTLTVTGIPSTGMLRSLAPEELFRGIGGTGGLRKRFDQFRKEGMGQGAAAKKAMFVDRGELTHFEDMPQMYDYEFSPQLAATECHPNLLNALEKQAQPDAIITGLIDTGVPEFESYATRELGKLLEERGKTHFSIGCGLTREVFDSFHPGARAGRGDFSEEDLRVIGWLDQQVKEHGERSVAYVCFGSIVWPVDRPEVIQYIIQGLLATDMPFLWCMSSKWGESSVVDQVKKEAEDSGRAMVTDWVPQMSVLQHPAVRLFVSHCGAGSMVESVYAGVPIVAVPFVNDEAYIARQPHGAAIQLHQINSGMKGRPLGVGGIVTEDPKDILAEMAVVYGTFRDPARYEQYRGNVRRLSSLLEGSLRDGESEKALQRFIDTYL